MSAARRWAPSAAWVAIVLVATSLPGSSIEAIPMFVGVDKVVHAFLYGVLGFLVSRAVADGPRRPLQTIVRVVVGIALIAALDEWHQKWIPGREAEAADWIADVTGALTGATLWLAALRRRETIS